MVEFLIYLNIITRDPVNPLHYMDCEQSSWMISRIESSELLSEAQKADFILRSIEGTDPSCFEDEP